MIFFKDNSIVYFLLKRLFNIIIQKINHVAYQNKMFFELMPELKFCLLRIVSLTMRNICQNPRDEFQFRVSYENRVWKNEKIKFFA